MVTKDNMVYCNICDKEMGHLNEGEFRPHPHIDQGGYLRIQVHDMQKPPIIFECDYCPMCSKRVGPLMKSIKVWAGI